MAQLELADGSQLLIEPMTLRKIPVLAARNAYWNGGEDLMVVPYHRSVMLRIIQYLEGHISRSELLQSNQA